jgi:hypothetical protein
MMWFVCIVLARRSRWTSSMKDGGRDWNELCTTA